MKKLLFIFILSVAIAPATHRAWAQSQEAQQLLLNWAKLQQLREILDNMYKGYKILDKGYNTIKNIAEGNYGLHQLFLDGLYAVNPSIKKYKRIPYIIEYQKLLVEQYKRAYNRFKQDPNFTPSELLYMERVYSNLIAGSLRNLDELIMIITATKLRMNDAERLQAIDRIYFDMQGRVSFVQTFNNEAQLLAVQRAKDRNDVSVIRELYGIDN
jgi:hypothetical protein